MSKNNSNGFEDRSNDPKFEPVQAQPLEVKVFNNFDKAFRTFRALVQKERILSLYKEKQTYEKPSDKKRRKHNEMKKRILDLELKNKKILSGEYEKEKNKKREDKEEKSQ